MVIPRNIIITPRCLDHYELRCPRPECDGKYHPGSATFDSSNDYLFDNFIAANSLPS